MIQPRLHHFSDPNILMEQLGVIFSGIPPRTPGVVVAKPITDWICFLTHALYASIEKNELLPLVLSFRCCHDHGNVTRSLLNCIGSAHRPSTNTFVRWPAINESLGDYH